MAENQIHQSSPPNIVGSSSIISFRSHGIPIYTFMKWFRLMDLKPNSWLVATAPGLYFVGPRFRYTVGFQAIYGMGSDAQYVAQQIAANSLV